MWDNALLVSQAAWAALGVFLVYSTGALFLQGNFHQFLLAALLWGLSCASVVIFTILL